jgi:hypothetical protein
MHVSGMPHIVGKDFDKGYKLALDLTSIKGLHKKLWASKVKGVSISKILGLSRKMTFGYSLCV